MITQLQQLIYLMFMKSKRAINEKEK